MFIGDVRPTSVRVQLTRTWPTIAAALIVILLVGSQFTANRSGFQGPLHSLISDYVATPKSATVPWVGLGMAMAGLPNRWRIVALSLAVVLDVVFAAERLLRGGALTFGNGPLIVLTGLALVAMRRRANAEITPALPGIAFGLLVIVATKVGDSWLRITAIVRPKVFDEYALLADHALAQPSWLFGRLVHAAGPVLSGALHWVYIELPVAAMLVTIYQLRNVRTSGWPRHFLVPTFLLLALIGPVIYVLFPVVGPEFAFGDAGGGFQICDYWPHSLPPVDLSPRAVAFDGQTPRNCMPSMHTAWALTVFIHSRNGPRWLRVGGTLWLVCTVAATLGFGYHYGVDLVAGAVLCLTVEATLREPLRGRIWSRMGLVAFGATFLAVLLLCCRYLAEPMARHPLLFGPLIVGATAVFIAAFRATFFAGLSAPMEATTLSVRSSLAAAMIAGEPSPCAETKPSRA
ncbi:phosphatase PAP2 family protein [Mycobacterium sp. 1164966.3]|uniref:phosphatase PAP2 family protein n=1 Tax=Mycobacterium sp. 1164966.3 TaxID=1856861 RepID=UPI0009EF363E|nr:phosphatase PAP2 family protein [Mycobacterium sp. 1164966.3]